MSLAVDGVLDAISWLHPEYASLINFVKAHEDQIAGLAPVIAEAIKEGPNALVAAEKAAPDLVQAIRLFVGWSFPRTISQKQTDAHAENIVRKIVGAPLMTDAEQANYWSSNTGS